MKNKCREMAEEILQEYTNCYSEVDQECLEKMLRKLASEVAEEIFAEIEELFHILVGNETGKEFYSIVASEYAELKKKYTEEGKCLSK